MYPIPLFAAGVALARRLTPDPAPTPLIGEARTVQFDRSWRLVCKADPSTLYGKPTLSAGCFLADG